MMNDEISEALEGFQAYEPPASLYRFYSGSGLNALIGGTLKITPPKELNDPFEMSPGVETTSLTEEALRRNFLSAKSLPREAHSRHFRNEADYREWVERVVVRRRDLWAKHLEALRGAVTDAISAVFGVSCFSAFSEDILNGQLGIRHWAMYADNHQGFCIEYDGGHALFRNLAASKWLFPVSYHAERPTIGIAEFDNWTQLKNLQVLRQWSEMKCQKAWGEEMEWRLICPLTPDEKKRVEVSSVEQCGRTMHFLHIWRSGESSEERANSIGIKRVILGVRAPKELENDIRSALKQPHLRHVGLFRAKMCARHFALRLERA